MTITIEVSEEVRERIERDAEEAGLPIEAVAAARLADWYAAEDDEDEADSEAVAEIGSALADFEAAKARGERGLSIDAAFEELERRSLERSQKVVASSQRAA